jgi:hypothetical protein
MSEYSSINLRVLRQDLPVLAQLLRTANLEEDAESCEPVGDDPNSPLVDIYEGEADYRWDDAIEAFALKGRPIIGSDHAESGYNRRFAGHSGRFVSRETTQDGEVYVVVQPDGHINNDDLAAAQEYYRFENEADAILNQALVIEYPKD